MRFGVLIAACLLAQPALAGDPARDLLGKTYVLTTSDDGSTDEPLAKLGYDQVTSGSEIPADSFARNRMDIVAGENADAIVVFSHIVKVIDDSQVEWKITNLFITKGIGSETAMSLNCDGNSKGKPLVSIVFHDGGLLGQPVKNPKAGFKLDRQSGAVEKISGPLPACKATEQPFDG